MTKTEWKAKNRKARIETKQWPAIERAMRKKGLALPIDWQQRKEYGAKLVLLKAIHRETDPELIKEREAWDKLGNGVTPYLENSPENYGNSVKQTLKKYYSTQAIGDNGTDANAELDEIGATIVSSTIHTNEDSGREQVFPIV